VSSEEITFCFCFVKTGLYSLETPCREMLAALMTVDSAICLGALISKLDVISIGSTSPCLKEPSPFTVEPDTCTTKPDYDAMIGSFVFVFSYAVSIDITIFCDCFSKEV